MRSQGSHQYNSTKAVGLLVVASTEASSPPLGMGGLGGGQSPHCIVPLAPVGSRVQNHEESSYISGYRGSPLLIVRYGIAVACKRVDNFCGFHFFIVNIFECRHFHCQHFHCRLFRVTTISLSTFS